MEQPINKQKNKKITKMCDNKKQTENETINDKYNEDILKSRFIDFKDIYIKD